MPEPLMHSMRKWGMTYNVKVGRQTLCELVPSPCEKVATVPYTNCITSVIRKFMLDMPSPGRLLNLRQEGPEHLNLCGSNYSLFHGFWQSFISIEVCRDCIPALASSCKKQLKGFFVCLLLPPCKAGHGIDRTKGRGFQKIY